MYTIIKPNNHDEWLRHRTGGIGSSEVGTILGLNPFDTPYKLWRRKLGVDPPTPENFAMKAGHYLEDAVSRFYADETGKEIIKASAGDWLIVNNEKPHLRVSPDRTFWLPDKPKANHNKGILECKTTQMEIDADNLPQYWFCQLQYQLGVAELNQGAIAWLTMGRSFGYRDFVFDEDFFNFIVEEVDRFWTDNIVGRQEPLPINAEDVMLKNPRHKAGKQVEADWELFKQYHEIKELKGKINELTARKSAIEDEMKLTMGDAEALVYGKETLATWKSAKDKPKFDEKGFSFAHPELYAEFQKTTPSSRRFLLK